MDDKWIRGELICAIYYSVQIHPVHVYACLPCVALDMQSCGISTDGAVALSESLHLNNFIVVLDLRGNELIGKG